MSEPARDEAQPAWRIASAELLVAPDRLDAVDRFYREQLDFPGTRHAHELHLSVGAAHLTFRAAPGSGEPYYHFALLVPGNRFEEARGWLSARVPLLARPESEETTFDFDFWDALACYAQDPAGNIVELIAHRGVEDSPEAAAFRAGELLGVSELGIVTGELVAAVERLRAARLELWYGEVSDERESLGFVGRKAHTLILCSPGRPWLPTGRPAEPHPLDVVLGADRGPEVLVRAREGTVEAHVLRPGT